MRNEQLEERLGDLFVQGTKYQDKAAMKVVMEYCLPALIERVARSCDKRGRSRGFADIVASMTLMKALAKASTFDSEKPLMPWLTAIARRELIDLHRVEERLDRRYGSLDRMPRLPSQDEDELNKFRRRAVLQPPDLLARCEDEAKHRQQEEMLDEAIRNLAGLKRRVTEACRAGNSVGRIAVMLDLPPARVSKILFDVKAELRRRFG